MTPGFLMIVQVYMGENRSWAVGIFTLALFLNGAVTAGYLGNGLDIAPNFSGTIFGMANTLSSFGGFVSAYMVGVLTNDNVSIVSTASSIKPHHGVSHGPITHFLITTQKILPIAIHSKPTASGRSCSGSWPSSTSLARPPISSWAPVSCSPGTTHRRGVSMAARPRKVSH